MKKTWKVNRGWLLRQVLAGKFEVMCNYSYTDDYAYDAATNFGKTDWMDAKEYFTTRGGLSAEWHFKTKSGLAYKPNEDSDYISLIVYSNLSYTLRPKAEQPKPVQTKDTSFLAGLEVVEYSEKSVAIFGDTKAVKDQLKKIGARFNAYLLKDGVKTPGWVLPKSVAASLSA